MAWTPDWRKIEGGDAFQHLVNDLLAAEYGRDGRYEPFELPQDGGFDGRYEGLIDRDVGIFRVQATYKTPGREPAKVFNELKVKVRDEARRPRTGEDHLLFVTNAPLRENELRELEKVGNDEGIKTLVWSGTKLATLLDRHIDVAAFHFGADAPELLPSFLRRKHWLSTAELELKPPLVAPYAPLVDEIGAEIRKHLSGQVGFVVLLSGPPSSGRSRFLAELAISKQLGKDFAVRFYRHWDQPRLATSLEVELTRDRVGSRPLVLLFDDAERLGSPGAPLDAALEVLRRFVIKQCEGGRPTAAILTTTPALAKSAFTLLHRPSSAIDFIAKELPRVPAHDLTPLVKTFVNDGPHATVLARHASGSPGLAVWFARIFAEKGGLPPASGRGMVEDVLEQALRHTELTTHTARRLLGLVSLLAPFDPADDPTVQAVSEETGLSGREITDLLEEAKKAGVLRVMREGLRPHPRILGDVLVDWLCRNERDGGAGLVEKFLSLRRNEDRIPQNLAGAVLGHDTGEVERLLERLTERWAKEIPNQTVRERMGRLDLVRPFASLVPEQALKMVTACLDNSPSEPEGDDILDRLRFDRLPPFRPEMQADALGAVLSQIARAEGTARDVLRHVRHIAELGWTAYYDNHRPVSLAKEAFSYSRANSSTIRAAAGELKLWTEDPALSQPAAKIVLKVSINWLAATFLKEWSDRRAIHFLWQSLGVSDVVRIIRAKALDLVCALSTHPSSRIRRDTWLECRRIGQSHLPVVPSLAEIIRDERLKLVRLAADRWPVEQERWDVLSAIEQFLIQALGQAEAVRDEAQRILAHLERPVCYRVYRVLVDGTDYLEDLGPLLASGITWRQVVAVLHERVPDHERQHKNRDLALALRPVLADTEELLAFFRQVDEQAPYSRVDVTWTGSEVLLILLRDVAPEWWSAISSPDWESRLPLRFRRMLRWLQSHLDWTGLLASAHDVATRPTAYPEDEVIFLLGALMSRPPSPDVAALFERIAHDPRPAVREAVCERMMHSPYREQLPRATAATLTVALRSGKPSSDLLDLSATALGEEPWALPDSSEKVYVRHALMDHLRTLPNLVCTDDLLLFLQNLCVSSTDELLDLLGVRFEKARKSSSDMHTWLPDDFFFDYRHGNTTGVFIDQPEVVERLISWFLERRIELEDEKNRLLEEDPTEETLMERRRIWQLASELETAISSVAGGHLTGFGVQGQVALELAQRWLDAGDLRRAGLVLSGMTATEETVAAGLRLLIAAEDCGEKEFDLAKSVFGDLMWVSHVWRVETGKLPAPFELRKNLMTQAIESAPSQGLSPAIIRLLKDERRSYEHWIGRELEDEED